MNGEQRVKYRTPKQQKSERQHRSGSHSDCSWRRSSVYLHGVRVTPIDFIEEVFHRGRPDCCYATAIYPDIRTLVQLFNLGIVVLRSVLDAGNQGYVRGGRIAGRPRWPRPGDGRQARLRDVQAVLCWQPVGA